MSSREAQIRGHFGKCVLTPVHRCIPPCSVSVTFASEESQWAWGLRHWASLTPLYPCGRLSRTLSRGSAFLRPQTTMPRLTPSRTSGFRSGCPCSTLHSPYHSLEGLPCSLHRTYLWIALRWRVHLRVPSPLWGSPSSS